MFISNKLAVIDLRDMSEFSTFHHLSVFVLTLNIILCQNRATKKNTVGLTINLYMHGDNRCMDESLPWSLYNL